ncbi:hypothetical protein [Actinoplanes regularis]|uniref:Peptide zinc metalloprotease protein n=1 Tax=Actinoplanes regularis TaxID=52697 RepID=A0A239HED2_9ACTN|nr:hypothetical protein [Actinoplanes regularis]GIE91013.1 hypothetical protein Are01nite_74930 [Actinoplanes regularis]SNS79521.1 hypothetical protein SAMN06264365_12452 [Actinoplanes regularis]
MIDLDRAVTMPPLVYLDEGDEVTVGRPDTDSYAVLPADGAELVRRLADGMTPRAAARWYAEAFGADVDIEEFLADLAELNLAEVGPQPVPAPAPVRFQRLGRLLLAPPALLGYGLIVLAAVVMAARHHDLAPGYGHLFFTPYFAVVEIGLFLGQFPLMLLHESAHVLAGRRLGLRTRVSVGFRFYYFVLQTEMDGLVAVPARKRVLPMVAGVGTDLVVASLLTLIAAALRGPGGSQPLLGRLALALAFTTLLRVVWQFYFFLRTDLYYVVSLVLGCVDLHGTAKAMLRNRFWRLRRRPDRLVDGSAWHPRDVRAGRWYAAFMVAGYGLSALMLVVAVLPAAYHFVSGVLGHLNGSAGVRGVADAAAFLGLNLLQLALVATLAVRARRSRRRPVPA